MMTESEKNETIAKLILKWFWNHALTGWVLAAGQDPVSWLKKMGRERLRTVHVKDCRRTPKLEWVEVGTGELDAKEVVKACNELGVEWGLVEQDTCARPPLESAAISAKYLLGL